MADRGEYRSIRTVLIDGPDFQALSPEARWVFIALKLNLGPSGIDVFYDAALEPQTGYSRPMIDAALAELKAGGWIDWERNVWCVIDGILHEPSISVADEKHRKGVRRHLDGLPSLGVVKRFAERHATWFPADEQQPRVLTKGRRRASEGPSDPLGSTEEGGGRTETETETTPPTSAGEVADRLRAVPGGEAVLATFLAERPASKDERTLLALLAGWLNGLGLPGGKAAAPETIVAALGDYLAATPQPRDYGPKHIRSFVVRELRASAGATSPGENGGSRIGAGGRTYLNAMRVLGGTS